MAARKKNKGILRPQRSITNKRNVPRVLKPSKTRKIIRKFHILNKAKASAVEDFNQILNLNSSSKLNFNTFKEELEDRYKQYHSIYLSYIKNPQKGKSIDSGILDKVEFVLQKIAGIDLQIESQGGLEVYQVASTQGQNKKRGGDSSKKLVEWLTSDYYFNILRATSKPVALEIGCLDPKNCISTCGIFKSVSKIDLNSQDHQILQQDFMKRPLPKDNSEKFNLISCSLVLNFVPTPQGRGEMLKRITYFLKPPSKNTLSSVFIVLPSPCVNNSRYFDSRCLDKIMEMLNFRLRCTHEAKKVTYWLYNWLGFSNKRSSASKKEIYSETGRNNFCITLQ